MFITAYNQERIKTTSIPLLKQRKSAAGLEHRYKVNEQLHTIFNRTIRLLPRHKPLLPRFRDRFLELPVTCRAR